MVAVRRQLKRQMRGFPAAPCCVDPRFKLKALAPSAPAQPSIADMARGVVNLGNAGTLALSSTRYVVLFSVRCDNKLSTVLLYNSWHLIGKKIIHFAFTPSSLLTRVLYLC